jgi:hypothetical protein
MLKKALTELYFPFTIETNSLQFINFASYIRDANQFATSVIFMQMHDLKVKRVN